MAAADTNRRHMGPELTETIGCILQRGNTEKRVNNGDARGFRDNSSESTVTLVQTEANASASRV